jgi:Ca2+-binding EF-hand superfamily protein
VSPSQVHAAAATFAQWDLDHDGVLGREEFALVINGLARQAGLNISAETVQRLHGLSDQSSSGEIDFNEFLAIHKLLKRSPQ